MNVGAFGSAFAFTFLQPDPQKKYADSDAGNIRN